MSKFAILLGGDLELTARLQKQIAGAVFIAADSGIKHASVLGITPSLWVGDFDSAGSELVLDFAHVLRLTFSTEKDATDGEIAVNEALRLGATEIILVGAFGGQADHAFAHLTLALSLAKRDVKCFASSGTEEAHPLLSTLVLDDLKISTRMSVLPMSDIGNINIVGVKWPLVNRDLALGETLTLSNVVTAPVSISITSGYGLVFIYPESAI